MTDKATHTPLPWTVSSGCDQYICNGDHWIASTMGIRGEEGAANAAFIVHAVNSHHDLIEALREAVAQYGKPGGPWNVPSDPGGWLSRAQSALTKAEAGHG